MERFKVSYSFLSLWSKGKVDEAIDCWFHTNQKPTEAMKQGKDIHKQIENHILSEGLFPPFMPQIPLHNPLPEQKYRVKYNELFDLSFVIDLEDGLDIHEFKTGRQSVLKWANTEQIPLYFLGKELMGVHIDKAYLSHYNQYTSEKEFVIIYNTPKLISKAKNFIDSIAPEAYQFFKDQGLI
jgi:hypothetical protein